MGDFENLRITSAASPDGDVVVQLFGELDLGTVPILVGALDDLLDGDPVAIELDMAELTFIDSSGVGAYVTAFRRARAMGSRLTLGERSGIVQRVLQLSGVEEALAREAVDDK
jgi:anti-sigma B factor antagonist